MENKQPDNKEQQEYMRQRSEDAEYLALVNKYEKTLDEEPDYDSEEDEGTIIGYTCMGCQHTQDTDGFCEMCCGYCLTELYE